jgi:hypothetical protein
MEERSAVQDQNFQIAAASLLLQDQQRSLMFGVATKCLEVSVVFRNTPGGGAMVEMSEIGFQITRHAGFPRLANIKRFARGPR